jgi:hypothetical protein
MTIVVFIIIIIIIIYSIVALARVFNLFPKFIKLFLGESEKLDEGADEKPGFFMWI